MYFPYIEPDEDKGYERDYKKMCGKGKIEILDQSPKPPHMRALYVRFEKCAHTKWHIHTGEQLLLATEGIGFVEFQDRPEVKLQTGDRIIIPADTLHRHGHGAQDDEDFVHLAVTYGQTEWSEDDPCTDEKCSRN